MIGFDYGHGWSSTGWETSFYGGYDRTLYDMPDVKVDYDVRVNIPLKSKMSYYNGQKLLKTYGVVECLETNLLRQALQEAAGNRSQAARALGMSLSTLRDKLRKYGLDPAA